MYPILFKIGSFPVHTYGVIMIVAFLAGLWIARKRAPKYGIDPQRLSDMAFLTLIVGVLGARIAFFVQEPPKDWHEYFSLQFAGLTSFGGLIGGALVVVLWARRTKTALRPLLDVLGPALLVGWAIGRVGCLLNGCCAGGICPPNFPLGVRISAHSALHYPAQMVDSLLNLAAFGIVLLAERKIKLQVGQVFALSLGLQGLARFIYEFWRAGTPAQVETGLASSTYLNGLPITDAQAAAAIIIVVSIVLFVVYARKRPVGEPIPA